MYMHMKALIFVPNNERLSARHARASGRGWLARIYNIAIHKIILDCAKASMLRHS